MVELTVVYRATNEELALDAQQGSRASFAELVARFQAPLLHFLRPRTATLHDAEDLTQDVFVRAFRSLDGYSSQWRFSTWLFTIAHRLSLNARRRRRPTVDSTALMGLAAMGPTPEETLAQADAVDHLWRRAALALTTRQLTTLWLFYVEEMSLEEIGRVIGKSSTAAKGLLFRGRRKLAVALHKLNQAAVSPPGTSPSVETACSGGAVRQHSLESLPPRLSAELTHG